MKDWKMILQEENSESQQQRVSNVSQDFQNESIMSPDTDIKKPVELTQSMQFKQLQHFIFGKQIEDAIVEDQPKHQRL